MIAITSTNAITDERLLAQLARIDITHGRTLPTYIYMCAIDQRDLRKDTKICCTAPPAELSVRCPMPLDLCEPSFLVMLGRARGASFLTAQQTDHVLA